MSHITWNIVTYKDKAMTSLVSLHSCVYSESSYSYDKNKMNRR